MLAIVPRHESRAIVQIGEALAHWCPDDVQRIEVPRKDSRRGWLVQGEDQGDLLVLFVNGMRDHYMAQAARARARGQKYAVVQIALRTTRHPRTEQWRELWRGASVVWSYYPLGLWIAEEGGAPIDFNFFHAPLGVDADVFKIGAEGKRPYTICTSGYRRNQEGVAECDEAVHALGEKLLQLGPTFEMRSDTSFLSGISDADLADFYGQCQFVSGLRRTEGFELPAAEGLLCGARPVLFDRPHYRCWYEPWGEFVREDSFDLVKRDLIQLFDRGARPVTGVERAAAAKLFDWERICKGFWERANA